MTTVPLRAARLPTKPTADEMDVGFPSLQFVASSSNPVWLDEWGRGVKARRLVGPSHASGSTEDLPARLGACLSRYACTVRAGSVGDSVGKFGGV